MLISPSSRIIISSWKHNQFYKPSLEDTQDLWGLGFSTVKKKTKCNNSYSEPPPAYTFQSEKLSYHLSSRNWTDQAT